MVAVYKTNVERESDAQMIRRLIAGRYPGCRVSFDLDDCDKVLRVEGAFIDDGTIIDLVARNKYSCSMLPD